MKIRFAATLIGVATMTCLSYGGLEGYIVRRGEQVVAGVYNSDRLTGWGGTPNVRSARCVVHWTATLHENLSGYPDRSKTGSQTFWVELPPTKRSEVAFMSWGELMDIFRDDIYQRFSNRFGERGVAEGLAAVGITRQNFWITVEAEISWQETGYPNRWQSATIRFAGSYPGYRLAN